MTVDAYTLVGGLTVRREPMGFAELSDQMTKTGVHRAAVTSLTPHSKMFSGGHRFKFSAEGDKTRVDHELEMKPRGIWVLMSPMMGMMSKKNLRNTAAALQEHMESK